MAFRIETPQLVTVDPDRIQRDVLSFAPRRITDLNYHDIDRIINIPAAQHTEIQQKTLWFWKAAGAMALQYLPPVPPYSSELHMAVADSRVVLPGKSQRLHAWHSDDIGRYLMFEKILPTDILVGTCDSVDTIYELLQLLNSYPDKHPSQLDSGLDILAVQPDQAVWHNAYFPHRSRINHTAEAIRRSYLLLGYCIEPLTRQIWP